MLDASSFYAAEHLALVQLLSERASTELERVAPRPTRSGASREAVALDGLEAMLEERRLQRAPVDLDEPEALLAPRWSALGRLIALTTLELGGRLELAPSATAMLDAAATAFEITAELASIHADLLQGRPTYPIAVVTRAAGLSLQPWPDPTFVLGALVTTGALGTIVERAIERVGEGRRIAVDLGLRTFGAYLNDVQAGLAAGRPRIGPGGALPGPGASGMVGRPGPPTPPLVTIERPTMAQALSMAEASLLSDPTFRESWELHREGMFGAPEVASRYPAGLILEILSAHGLGVSAGVDEFLAFTVANGFRYFDHPWSGVDSDTIGVYLRLARHATPGRQHDEAVEAALACLERDVATSGRVPVWVSGCGGDPAGRPPILDLGEECGTVAAHLLLGLLAYDPRRYAETIERGSRALLTRIVDVGLGANVNYPRAYALAAFGRLIARLERETPRSSFGADVSRAATKARGVLEEELDRAVAWRVMTPQQAALLTIACLDMGRPDRLDPTWTTAILKGQRFDGSWPGEPFAAAPNRGRAVTWYSSTLLTSALCYDALVRAKVSSSPGGSPPRPGLEAARGGASRRSCEAGPRRT